MILVSAGHYEKAQGAQWNGFTEWREAEYWKDRILLHLGYHGMSVPSGTLREKVEFINNQTPLAAIEIHFNSAIVNNEHVGKGCETLYCPGSKKGLVLAEKTQEAMGKFFRSRGVKAGWYRQDRPGMVDYHGDKDGDEKILYFLLKTQCPAIIIEPEFIHLMAELQAKRDKCCMAIATALLDYIEDVEQQNSNPLGGIYE